MISIWLVFCSFLFGLGSTRLLLISLKIKPLKVETLGTILPWFIGGSSNFVIFWACSRSDLAQIPFGIVLSMSSYLGGLGVGLIADPIIGRICEWIGSPIERVLRQNLSERQIEILIIFLTRDININDIAAGLNITEYECEKDFKIALKKLQDVGKSVLVEYAKNLDKMKDTRRKSRTDGDRSRHTISDIQG